jgi:hypothetical protein
MFSGFKSVWIKFRSWRTETVFSSCSEDKRTILTSHTCEELASEALYLGTWKGCEGVGFQEVEHTLAKKIRNYTDVISKVEAVSKMDTLVAIVSVVGGERG